MADDEISDEEIIAATVRYARAAPPGRTAAEVLEFLKADFPEVSERRIRRCMGESAKMMLRQHSIH